jgi:hypothetical protein
LIGLSVVPIGNQKSAIGNHLSDPGLRTTQAL